MYTCSRGLPFQPYMNKDLHFKIFLLAIPGLFFFIFVFSIQLLLNKICWWLDLNRGSLVSEATPLPTESQPLPNFENNLF